MSTHDPSESRPPTMSTTPTVPNLAWSLWDDRGPARTLAKAQRIAAALGGVLDPIAPLDTAEGLWLCTTDADLATTLVEVGFAGLANDDDQGNQAEAEWPTPTNDHNTAAALVADMEQDR